MSSFTAEEIGTLAASLRPLGLSVESARAVVFTHPENPVQRLMKPSPVCLPCALLATHPTAVLQQSLWLPAPGLEGGLEWKYGAVCRIVPGTQHATVQHSSHPPGQLRLCQAAAAGWIRLVAGRPRIGLVACSAAKLDVRAPVRELYQGQLFRKAKAFVERWCHGWAVLSARHQVVLPNEVLEPYDERMPRAEAERERWDQMVSWEIYRRWKDADLVLLGGEDYARWLRTGSWSRALSVIRPLEGLGIGQQKAWLGKAIREGFPVEPREITPPPPPTE